MLTCKQVMRFAQRLKSMATPYRVLNSLATKQIKSEGKLRFILSVELWPSIFFKNLKVILLLTFRWIFCALPP